VGLHPKRSTSSWCRATSDTSPRAGCPSRAEAAAGGAGAAAVAEGVAHVSDHAAVSRSAATAATSARARVGAGRAQCEGWATHRSDRRPDPGPLARRGPSTVARRRQRIVNRSKAAVSGAALGWCPASDLAKALLRRPFATTLARRSAPSSLDVQVGVRP
jgi:hypothetical protein